MIDANLIERVRALCGGKVPIEADTELYGDISLNGDDAYQLLDEIRKDYQVDFSGFEFGRYFPNETEAMYYLWGRRVGLWRNRFKPLTVGHLQAVIERRRWFEPPPGEDRIPARPL